MKLFVPFWRLFFILRYLISRNLDSTGATWRHDRPTVERRARRGDWGLLLCADTDLI